jgi:FkbM family methyltransferase
MSFETELVKSFAQNLNNYYLDNYDYMRFGERKIPFITSVKRKIISKLATLKYFKNPITRHNEELFETHFEIFKHLYNLLGDEHSKKILIDVLLYRILGNEKIKLPLNKDDNYFNQIKKLEALADKTKFIDVPYAGYNLYLHNLSKIDRDIKLYFTTKGIFADFVLKQYEYHNSTVSIKTEKEDVVLDCGGCWGDTALYFANEAGANGKVYSFEFIPTNLDIFKKNLEQNPNLSPVITLIENPLWDKSDIKLFYKDAGPGSRVSFNNDPNMSDTVLTLSIDNFVTKKNVQKVSFIKMDIEGAESKALAGAEQTIRKFRPKLAIALYHSLSDFEIIPKWINNLNLGYTFYLGHFSIHAEETILFAKPK